MTVTAPSWWIVLLPGEYAETSEVFGPFRSERAAETVADRWNDAHPQPEDRATVLPVCAPTEMQ